MLITPLTSSLVNKLETKGELNVRPFACLLLVPKGQLVRRLSSSFRGVKVSKAHVTGYECAYLIRSFESDRADLFRP